MIPNKDNVFISAILYVHNDEKAIDKFLTKIIHVFEENFSNSEIICVNDCSDDNSVSIIRETSPIAETTSISIVNLSYFHGLELAMNAGRDLSIGDFVFEFDNIHAQFNDSLIMQVYQRSREGFDIVSASPTQKEQFSSRIFYKVFNHFSNGSYRMTTETFRLLSRRVINRISSMNRSIPYRKAVFADCGLTTDNIRYPGNAGTKTNSDKKEKIYRIGLAADSLILFTELGYRFSITMTAIMMMVAAFMVIYSVVAYLIIHPIEGWTTTILFLSVAFLGLFGILTIIIKYLQIILNLVFKRTQYFYESIEKLTK